MSARRVVLQEHSFDLVDEEKLAGIVSVVSLHQHRHEAWQRVRALHVAAHLREDPIRAESGTEHLSLERRSGDGERHHRQIGHAEHATSQEPAMEPGGPCCDH